MKLAPWQEEIVRDGELYRVGGAVRDRMLGRTHIIDTDFLVRGLPPDALEAILGRHGRVQLVGRSFGVYKFTPAGDARAVDIVYPRRERSTGVRHRDFDVQWDWRLRVEDDLGRRDFTINAIAERLPDDRRIDPFDGEGDIARRTLRMIFPEAFEEDPLRVLRGARFAGRFDLTVDPVTWARMRDAAPLTATVSAERVQEETTRMLEQCERPSIAIDMLQRLGVLEIWFPELSRCVGVTQNEYHPDDVYWHSLKTCDAAPAARVLVRWAALLHDTGKVDAKQAVNDALGERVVFYGHESFSADHAVRLLQRLRYGHAFVEQCRHLVQEHMFHYVSDWKPSTLRRFIRRIGIDALDDLFALREADARSRDLDAELDNLGELRARVDLALREQAALRITDLSVDGNDVATALGIAPGPAVGRALERLLDRVLDSPSLNERDTLLDILRREREDENGPEDPGPEGK